MAEHAPKSRSMSFVVEIDEGNLRITALAHHRPQPGLREPHERVLRSRLFWKNVSLGATRKVTISVGGGSVEVTTTVSQLIKGT